MPQVWLTYREMGEIFAVDALEARSMAIDLEWPRRRCSDGQTRVKLPPVVAHQFMLAYANGQSEGPAPLSITNSVFELQKKVVALEAELRGRPDDRSGEEGRVTSEAAPPATEVDDRDQLRSKTAA